MKKHRSNARGYTRRQREELREIAGVVYERIRSLDSFLGREDFEEALFYAVDQVRRNPPRVVRVQREQRRPAARRREVLL